MTRDACEGCYYYGWESDEYRFGNRVCNYNYITGQSRQCPAGEGCKVRKGAKHPKNCRKRKRKTDRKTSNKQKEIAKNWYRQEFRDTPEQVSACLNCDAPAENCGGECKKGIVLPLVRPHHKGKK